MYVQVARWIGRPAMLVNISLAFAAVVLATIWVGAVPDLDFDGREHLDMPGQSSGSDHGKFNGPGGCLCLGRSEIRLLAGYADKLLSDVNLAAQEVEAANF
jgi:hypothetical protein